jgi:Concanavalin A-like lectin/glucanases superfamily
MADNGLRTVYSDRKHVYTTTVRHQGTTIAFAMDDQRRIRYSVLDLERAGVPAGSHDAAYWSAEPSDLVFPADLVQVGYAAAGNTRMPEVRKGGRIEAVDQLPPDEVDPFLSTTARLTALAPFQVVSDGRHVVVFRQSIDGAHADGVCSLTSGAVSGDPARTDYLRQDGARVPLVDGTLLCDRFVLAGGRLAPLREVRFRRSRDRAIPGPGTDTLGTSDMDGKPFAEPTQHVSFVRRLSGGAFAVVLLPTVVAGVFRWQLFARNDATGRIDAFNVEQGPDGLFDTRGTQLYTSPDAKYAPSVLERQPGTCPFTKLELVPVPSDSGMAETALRLDGTSGCVSLGSPATLKVRAAYTLEAWVSPAGGGTILSKGAADQPSGFALAIDAAGKLALTQGGATVTSTDPLPTGAFRHVAAVFDGTIATLYVNGASAGSGASTLTPDDASPALIGAMSGTGGPTGFFKGDVDEVRVWNRARAADELQQDRGRRLIGTETGLVAYYRFDEGAGTDLYDETDAALNGTIQGGCTWVTSTAGVGDGPGLSRTSFGFKDRKVVSGLGATMYFQQESTPAGYEGTTTPVKRQARVLLACATSGPAPAAGDASRAYMATLDLAVGHDGRLARVTRQVALAAVGKPNPSADANAISALEQRIMDLEGRRVENEAIVTAEARGETESKIASYAKTLDLLKRDRAVFMGAYDTGYVLNVGGQDYWYTPEPP